MSLYNELNDISEKLRKQICQLEIQKVQNDITLMKEKALLYKDYAIGVLDIHEISYKVSSYLNDIKEKKITRATKCDGKTYYQILKESIEEDTKIEIREITRIVFNGITYPKIDIYFKISDSKKEFFISIPEKDDDNFDPSFHDIYDKSNFSNSNYGYVSREAHIIDGINRLSTVLGVITDKSEYVESHKPLASFPEDCSDLSEFREMLSKYLLGKE